jgi:hypothetical protein
LVDAEAGADRRTGQLGLGVEIGERQARGDVRGPRLIVVRAAIDVLAAEHEVRVLAFRHDHLGVPAGHRHADQADVALHEVQEAVRDAELADHRVRRGELLEHAGLHEVVRVERGLWRAVAGPLRLHRAAGTAGLFELAASA